MRRTQKPRDTPGLPAAEHLRQDAARMVGMTDELGTENPGMTGRAESVLVAGHTGGMTTNDQDKAEIETFANGTVHMPFMTNTPAHNPTGFEREDGGAHAYDVLRNEGIPARQANLAIASIASIGLWGTPTRLAPVPGVDDLLDAIARDEFYVGENVDDLLAPALVDVLIADGAPHELAEDVMAILESSLL